MKRGWRSAFGIVAIVLAMLACGQQAPEYVIRGWTATPSPTATALASRTPTPIVIYIYPTEVWYTATVLADQLEIRTGPATKYPSNPELYLSRGDQITVMACRFDALGEAWVNLYWPKKKIYGWSAVTWRGAIFLFPMPGSCK